MILLLKTRVVTSLFFLRGLKSEFESLWNFRFLNLLRFLNEFWLLNSPFKRLRFKIFSYIIIIIRISSLNLSILLIFRTLFLIFDLSLIRKKFVLCFFSSDDKWFLSFLKWDLKIKIFISRCFVVFYLS